MPPKFKTTSNLAIEVYEHDLNRGKWASKTEYVLTIIGYAVGVSNVVRFPYLCYRSGGGAFLIPYFLMLILCGIPLFYMEICIGQFSSTSCVGMFRLAPLFKGCALSLLLINLVTACYYSLMIAYPIRYLYTFMKKDLPFKTCDNEWNTEDCRVFDVFVKHDASADLKTPSDEFFHHEILQISKNIGEIGTIVWPLFLSLTITWVLIYLCISRGLNSVGKVVYFTAVFPYVILFIFLIRGITLPGAGEGIRFYMEPDWSKLGDFRIWADAAVQMFLSLGPGWGGIVNMASFNNVHNNVRIDAIVLPLVNCCTSVVAGFFVFSVLGFLSHQSGVPVSKVASTGPGLAYVTYPEAISRLPVPHLWGILFFFMLVLLGIDSIIECILGTVLDAFPIVRPKKHWLTLGVCIFIYLMAIIMTTNAGMYIVTLLDWYLAALTVILICILETVMSMWNYGVDRFMLDVQFLTGNKVWIVWKYLWKYVCLVCLVMIFLTTIVFNRRISYNHVPYPDWAVAVGWLSAITAIGIIPSYIVYELATKRGTLRERIRHCMEVTDWSPALPEDKADYEIFLKEQEILREEAEAQAAALKREKAKERANRNETNKS